LWLQLLGLQLSYLLFRNGDGRLYPQYIARNTGKEKASCHLKKNTSEGDGLYILLT
jgi:hypothetical protein